MWWDSVAAIAVYAVVGAAALLSAVHALLNKRDPRSQLGWVVLSLLVPAIGPFFYWLIGVNRIKTRARRWQARGRWAIDPDRGLGVAARDLAGASPARAETMLQLLHLSRRVTGRPLVAGNKVTALHNGEQAYPAMLEAIAGARESVCLCTYIFETDPVGRQFVDALAAAGARGVKVCVLVDAIGERYSRPRVSRLLRHRPGVQVARFLPLAPSMRALRVNLRNHRKILTVDSEVGFTGGMNLGGRHMATDPTNRKQTVDLHFKVEGPAVGFLEEAFYGDWQFTVGQEDWVGYRDLPPRGSALCRGIIDGPNEDFERLQWILVGALTCARTNVRIMTPYFIPNRELIAVLNATALRGVDVEIVLPRKSNLPYVAWATDAMLWELLQHGVRFYQRPPPFAHSKLFMVDDYYINVGSANLDPRSLRLNFEFNLEIFDSTLGAELALHFEEVKRASQPVTLEQMESRPFPIKLRDATAKLFAPYL